MSLLDNLKSQLGLTPVARPEGWAEFLATKGLKPGMDVGPQRLTELQKQFDEWQSANQQAPGLAKQLFQAGMGGDIGAQTPAAAAARAMMNPATRQLGVKNATALLTPLTTEQQAALSQSALQFQQTLANEKLRTEAYITNLNWDNATKASAAQLAQFQKNVSNETELRKEVITNPVVVKTAASMSALDQLDRALARNDFFGLRAAVMALVRVQEPGRLTGIGDRLEYDGQISLASELVSLYNKTVSGKGIDPEQPGLMRGLAMQLASVNAKEYARVIGQYQDLATRTPGVRPDMVVRAALKPSEGSVGFGTGVDPAMLQLLLQVP